MGCLLNQNMSAALLLLAAGAYAAAPASPTFTHNLARSDPLWAWNSSDNPAKTPAQWSDGPFAGNGLLGFHLTVAGSVASLEVDSYRTDSRRRAPSSSSKASTLYVQGST
jgi:hypothetical protein